MSCNLRRRMVRILGEVCHEHTGPTKENKDIRKVRNLE